MIRLAFKDRELMKFLHVEVRTIENDIFGTAHIPDHAIIIDDLHYAIKNKDNKDKGQRDFCGCVVSKDIGQYNTCPHQCKYCYANTSRDSALANYKRHRENISSDMIIGG
jgi:sulfatase maturation enzyme AslB (radical SAM superfamily)